MRYFELAFTRKVQAAQAANGAGAYAKHVSNNSPSDTLGKRECDFIAQRDSFYLGTVGETGWPYVQHRGGPSGFVKMLDEYRLAIADYRGNRQYISLGNFSGNNRVSLFFMDYPNRARLKVMARANMIGVDEDAALRAVVANPAYNARIERILTFTVEAFDWNCPQHITPRFTEAEIQNALLPIEQRLTAYSEKLRELGLTEAEIEALATS